MGDLITLDVARAIVAPLEAAVLALPPRRAPRPTMFRADGGVIIWTTPHGPVRLTEAMAIQLRDILLEGGNMPAYFDLDEALLDLSDPMGAA